MSTWKTKYENESIDQYFVRLVSSKECEKLTWQDIADCIYANGGPLFSESTWRKRARQLNRILCYEDRESTSEFDIETKLQNKYQQILSSDERTQLNAMYRRLSREDSLKEIARDCAQKMSTYKALYIPKKSEIPKGSNSALLLISDWHYGVEYSGVWNSYNVDVAVRRVQELLTKTIAICKQNNIKNLHIFNLGDMIAGNIHLPIRINSRENVIDQVMHVSELIAEFLVSLETVCKVDYYSCIDNHSRIDPNKKEAIQLESLSLITTWYLRERLKLHNIEFHNNYYGPDIIDARVGELAILGVHGDKDKQSTMIDKLTSYTQQHWDIICSSHMHHFSADESNDTLRISNGSLMGTDEFSSSLRLSSRPSQTMIVFTLDKSINNIVKINLE